MKQNNKRTSYQMDRLPRRRRILGKRRHTHQHTRTQSSCQSEDTLISSSWGGCKIPKMTPINFVHLIEVYWPFSHYSLSRNTLSLSKSIKVGLKACIRVPFIFLLLVLCSKEVSSSSKLSCQLTVAHYLAH